MGVGWVGVGGWIKLLRWRGGISRLAFAQMRRSMRPGKACVARIDEACSRGGFQPARPACRQSAALEHPFLPRAAPNLSPTHHSYPPTTRHCHHPTTTPQPAHCQCRFGIIVPLAPFGNPDYDQVGQAASKHLPLFSMPHPTLRSACGSVRASGRTARQARTLHRQ